MPRANIKIRIPFDDVYAIGPGKADLLDAIIEKGSISAAAKLMGMSYKRAWDLVDTMNKSFSQAIVITSTGGSRGGGAEVTAFGLDVLKRYRHLQLLASQAISAEADALFALLR